MSIHSKIFKVKFCVFFYVTEPSVNKVKRLTLFYMGSGRYVNTWGGHFVPALYLSFKNAAEMPRGW